MYKFIYSSEKAPELKKSGIMCETVVASNLLSGFTQILQLGGLGRLRPNTVCFGYKKDWKTCSDESAALYESMVASSLANGRGVIIVRDPEKIFELPSLKKAAASAASAASTASTATKAADDVKKAESTSDSDEDDVVASINPGSKTTSDDGITVASVRSMSTANTLNKKNKNKKEKRRIDVYWLADVSC
jgi:hypothetical protein